MIKLGGITEKAKKMIKNSFTYWHTNKSSVAELEAMIRAGEFTVHKVSKLSIAEKSVVTRLTRSPAGRGKVTEESGDGTKRRKLATTKTQAAMIGQCGHRAGSDGEPVSEQYENSSGSAAESRSLMPALSVDPTQPIEDWTMAMAMMVKGRKDALELRKQVLQTKKEAIQKAQEECMILEEGIRKEEIQLNALSETLRM